MKKFAIILAFFLFALSGFAQYRPEIDIYNRRFTVEDGTGANWHTYYTKRLWGNVRIVTDPKEPEDLRVRIVKYGEPHKLDISVVEKAVSEDQWHWVTRKGDEDFTIRIVEDYWDISVLIISGYNPKTKRTERGK